MRAVKNNLPTPSGKVEETEGPRRKPAVEGNPSPSPGGLSGWGFDRARTGSQVGAKGEEDIG